MFLGYAVPSIALVSFISLIALFLIERKGIVRLLSRSIDKNSLMMVSAAVLFFVVVSAVFITPTEQLYFDENIYQGIALNILHHWNALWCQYGTGSLRQCYNTLLYHDPAEWSFFIAIAFAIFGASGWVAHALQLLVGALSIFLIFIFTGLATQRRHVAVLSSFVLATMPLLFIWARSYAVLDLPFMMLSLLSFTCLAIFTLRRNIKTFGLLLSSLLLLTYVRIEAILLLPLILILSFTMGINGIRKTLQVRMKEAVRHFSENTSFLIALLLFIILLLPQLYYLGNEFSNGNYGQSYPSQQLFSIKNFMHNAAANISFLFGAFNASTSYPAIFPETVTLFALLGILLLAIDKHVRNRFGLLLLLLGWFAIYFFFYGFFYAGSATFGVDSRFMLQLLPSLSILASLAIYEISSALARRLGSAAYAFSSAALFVLVSFIPFILLFPLTAQNPQNTQIQYGIAHSVAFIYNNYQKVPANCLVFSFTPDVWYGLNRSSAQISYISDNASLFKNFSCFIFDYGYWCAVPPYHSTTCSNILSSHSLTEIATADVNLGTNVSLYTIGTNST